MLGVWSELLWCFARITPFECDLVCWFSHYFLNSTCFFEGSSPKTTVRSFSLQKQPSSLVLLEPVTVSWKLPVVPYTPLPFFFPLLPSYVIVHLCFSKSTHILYNIKWTSSGHNLPKFWMIVGNCKSTIFYFSLTILSWRQVCGYLAGWYLVDLPIICSIPLCWSANKHPQWRASVEFP